METEKTSRMGMLKRFLSFALCFIMILSCVPATVFAVSSGTCGESLTWTISDDGVLTISGSGKMADYDFYSKAPWYGSWETIKNVVIQNGVTSIGESAFSGCSSLSSITIPAGVTSIGINAFRDCSSLSSISIPEGVTSIGSYAFGGCTNLSSITIPVGVTSINHCTFYNCSSLSSITIPEGVTSIGSYAFQYCSSLSSISIPEGVSSIEGYAFRGCSSLSSISIPEGVTSIGEYAFAYCRSLSSISILEGVTSIGASAFEDCSSLSSISIPEGVTTIGSRTFYGCSSLSSISIPEGVTSIGSCAFAYCSSLSSISIPEGVTSIGEYAFEDCSSLSSITIPEGVTSIGSRTFHGCSSLSSITIPEGVTSIGSRTFHGCSSLSSITIPEGVAYIGSGAFSGCSSLSSITIPAGVTSIGRYSFGYCSKLTNVTFLGAAPSIEDSAFYGVTATVQYPRNDPSWTADKRVNYGGNLTWVPSEEEVSNPLTSIDYLALSKLAYSNWSIGDTVYGKLKDKWNSVVDDSSDWTGITNKKLYGNIAGWKVIATSQSWGGATSNGFYAVTFQGKTTEGTKTVVAYRGSTGLDKVLTSDGFSDWIMNDIPFQVMHVYTNQLDDARNYYAFSLQRSDSGISAVTGHSLGGALASVASICYGVHAEIFNAASAYEALHKNRVISGFRGTDKWDVVSHVIDSDKLVGSYQDEYKVFKNKRYHYSGTKSNPGIADYHLLRAFLNYDSRSDSLTMVPFATDFSQSHRVQPENVALYLGFSGDEHITIPTGIIENGTRYGKNYMVYGGEGNDKIKIIGWSNDIIIGGSSSKSTVIDGGAGNDLYYYTKGDGSQAIHDVSGNDVIYLKGFAPGDKISYQKYDEYGIIKCGESNEIVIWLARSLLGSLKVVLDTGDSKQEYKLDGFLWGNISQSVMVACPVDVEILDHNGNVVQTLECGTEQTVYTDYGNFYVFTDQYGESVKYFDMIDGYTFRIRGVDDGTMSLSYCENEGEVFALTDVPVNAGMVTTVHSGDVPVLVIDEDDDGIADASMPMDTGILSGPEDVHSLVKTEAKAATCTEAGNNTYYTCTVCKGLFKDKAGTQPTTLKDETIPAEGHSPVTVEGKPASCTEEGLTDGETCSVCGATLVAQEVIPVTHQEETIPGKAATCTEDGLTDGKKCSVCGIILEEQQTIPAGHTEEIIPGKAATCTEDGLTDGKKCSVCGETIEEQRPLPAGHQLVKKEPQKATLEEDGYKKTCYACSGCDAFFMDEKGEEKADKADCVIPAVEIVRLSSTSYSYNGKTKTPKVGVYDSQGNKLVKDKDYTVTYAKGRKKVGQYNVTMKGIGNYSFRTTLTFKILPPKSAVYTPKALNNGFTAKWVKKTSQVTGYQLQYSLNSDFSDAKTVTIKDSSVVSKSIKKLKNKKTYYVRIRTYKTVSGKNFYSSWSAAKKVKTK